MRPQKAGERREQEEGRGRGGIHKCKHTLLVHLACPSAPQSIYSPGYSHKGESTRGTTALKDEQGTRICPGGDGTPPYQVVGGAQLRGGSGGATYISPNDTRNMLIILRCHEGRGHFSKKLPSQQLHDTTSKMIF